MIIDKIITSLSQQEDLKAIHTIIPLKHSKQQDSITMQFIEVQVMSVVHYVKVEVAPAANSDQGMEGTGGLDGTLFLLNRRANQWFKGNLSANNFSANSLYHACQ